MTMQEFISRLTPEQKASFSTCKDWDDMEKLARELAGVLPQADFAQLKQEYLSKQNVALSDEELDNVAGGKRLQGYKCKKCGRKVEYGSEEAAKAVYTTTSNAGTPLVVFDCPNPNCVAHGGGWAFEYTVDKYYS